MNDSIPNHSSDPADAQHQELERANGVDHALPESTIGTDTEPIEHDDEHARQLDRRWIRMVRTVEGAVWGGLGLALLVIGMVVWMVAPMPFPWIVIAAWLVLAIVALFRLVWWPRWAYAHWSYRVGRKVLELRYGILWNVSVSIPLSRLQHVDLHRGPLERHHGLASLEIHTAGTKESSQLIPGLDFEVAQSLRDRLIDAANRGGRGKHATTPA